MAFLAVYFLLALGGGWTGASAAPYFFDGDDPMGASPPRGRA